MPPRDIWPAVFGRWTCFFALTCSIVLLAPVLPAFAAGPKALMCSPLNPWLVRDSGTTSDLQDVIYANGTFVAVGASTNVTSSGNGVSWTNRVVTGVPPFPGSWNSITFGQNTFLAAGFRASTAVSSNGLIWTTTAYPGSASSVSFGERWFCVAATNGTLYTFTNTLLSSFATQTNLPGASWRSLIYGGSRFVCVARDGTAMMSTDATHWIRSSTGVSNLNRVTFGSGMFVAVGSNGVISTSTDGLSWTPRVSHSTANFTAVTFGGGRFVAVSDSSPNADDRLVNSRDGVNWCAYAMPTNGAWRGIAYGSNSFVIVGANGAVMQSHDQTLIVSPPQNQTVCAEDPVTLSVAVEASVPVRYQWQFNGTNITGATNPVFTLAKTFPEDAGPYRVTITDDRVRVTSTGLVQLNLCRAVERWKVQKPAGYQSNGLNSIACNGDTLVAVGNNGTIVRSADGVTWAVANSGTNIPLNAVAYGDGQFVAVGARGAIVSSSDGVTWMPRNSGTNGNLRGIIFAGSKFVVIAGNSYVLTSTDGLFWTARPTGTNRALAAIGNMNGQFVGVGSLGIVLTSPDAINWLPGDSGTTSNLFRIAAGNSTFVAVGDHIILRSENGTDWVSPPTPVSNIWRSVCFAHGEFVVAGDPGVLLVSRDGVSWLQHHSRVTNLVNAMVGCGDSFYSVFNDGWVSQSAFAALPRLRGEARPPLFTVAMKAGIGVPMRLQTRDGLSVSWTDVFAFTNARTTSTLLNTAITNAARRFYQVTSP